MATLTCQFCGKPCNDVLLYQGQYAHVGCAEVAYFNEATAGNVAPSDEDWYSRPYEERLAILRSR